MVNVFKFLTVVACQKMHKTNRADPDQTASKEGSSLVCYSDMSCPDKQLFLANRKRKVLETL